MVWIYLGSAAFLVAAAVVGAAFRRAQSPHRGWRAFGLLCVGMPVVGAFLSGLGESEPVPRWVAVGMGVAAAAVHGWAGGFAPPRKD